MTNPSQFIKESVYLDLLRAIDREWPKGKLIKSESPDFILKTGRKRSIGIELTDLTTPDTAHRDTVERIGERVRLRTGGNLFMQLFFDSENIIVSSAKEEYLVQLILEHIYSNQQQANQGLVIQQGLPEGVSMIFLLAFQDKGSSVFESKMITDVRRITPVMLKSTVRSKEEKLRIYRKQWTGQLWLVISISGLVSPASYNLRDKIEQWNIGSEFDRTVVFDITGRRSFRI